MVLRDRSSVSRDFFDSIDVQDLAIVVGCDDSIVCVFRTADFCDVRPASIHEADRGELRNSPMSTETSIISRESNAAPQVQLDITIEWKSETATSRTERRIAEVVWE